ncbi:MAG: hypothetical protein RR389_06425 [Christensenella sp.]
MFFIRNAEHFGQRHKVLALAGALSQSASLLRNYGFHHPPA